MDTNQSKNKMEEKATRKGHKLFLLSQILLRILAFGSAFSATLLMATNKQTITLFGLPIDAKYTYSNAFRFLVVANALASVYAVLSLLFVLVLAVTAGGHHRSFFMVFLLDLVMMGLVMAASSAASAIGYLGKYGNSHTGWSPVCNHFGKFCDKSTQSIICSFAAMALFLLLAPLSATKSRSVAGSPC